MGRPRKTKAEPEWLTFAQVADRYGVHERTVRKWACEGKIPAIRLPNGQLRVHRDVIEKIENPADPQRISA